MLFGKKNHQKAEKNKLNCDDRMIIKQILKGSLFTGPVARSWCIR